MPPRRRRFEVTGIVQGVGFRPFVYNLAREHALCGAVHNHTAGVTIEAEGDPEALASFERDLIERRPPLAVHRQLRLRHKRQRECRGPEHARPARHRDL
jgi:hydrogenase maturation protein HypF